MNKALIIAYHYWPANNGGVARPMRLARYLPALGWKMTVLTTGDGADSGPNGEHIVRAREPFRPATAEGESAPSAKNGAGRVMKNALKRMVSFPDGKRFWKGPALKAIKEYIRSERVDCIISTSPPETAHIIAAELRNLAERPWVADFRDGWTFEPPRRDSSSARRAAKMLRAEAEVIKAADAITSATMPIHEDFVARYPEFRDKMHYLPNGFDSEESATRVDEDASASSGKFSLLFTGRLSLSSAEITPRHLFDGLRAAAQRDAGLRDDCEFTLIGQFTEEEKSLANDLGNMVHFQTLVPRDEAISRQRNATVNILVASRLRRSVATGKIYEYLAARRPILALAQGTEAERIVAETDSGMCVAPDDAAEICEALLTLYGKWKDGALDAAFSFAGSERFDFQKISRDAAAILDNILHH